MASKAELMVLAVYMPPQEPGPGDGALLDGLEVGFVHAAHVVFADGFEHRYDGQVLALVVAGLDGAAIHVDAGHIHARERHHAAGHVLVASADDHHAIHPLPLRGGLDAVGDDLARHQRILHSFGAHGHAIGNRRRAEHLGLARETRMASIAASARRCSPLLHGVIVECPLATPIIGFWKSASV